MLVSHAAGRIGRAWRRFLASPGRLRAVAAVTRLQAQWRGWASRRRTAAELQLFRQRRALLADLHAAVSAGDLAQARLAAEQLPDVGAGPQAAKQVAQLEQRAAEAAAALRAMAERGGVDAYQAAAAAAQCYAHLAEARREAARQFAARVAAAEEAVESAAQGAPVLQFREAAAAAAALGVSAAFLARAEQRVALRQQQAAEALAAALAAAPFVGAAYQAALEHAQRCGLHADAARAQRGLQLRRHRAATALQQLAAEGGAAEVEAACQEAEQLGLEAEAHAALCRLEQRQAAATEELRQAAFHGSLQQFQAADATAAALQVSGSLRQSCREQVLQRQREAEQQLRLAAAGRGDLAAVRRRCRAAALLGLTAAVAEAERVVQQRREESVEQLARSTEQACNRASAAARAAEQRAEMWPACATPREVTTARQLLGGWLAAVQQLSAAVGERGAAAAFVHPPSACSSWPAELHGWLVDSHQAAELELGPQVLAATLAFQAHLETLHTAAQVAVTAVPLEPRQATSSRPGPSSSRATSRAALCASGEACASPTVRRRDTADAAAGEQKDARQLGTAAQTVPASAHDLNLLGRFQEWRASQEHLLPLVAGAAERAAAAAEAEREADVGESGHQGQSRLDLGCQGLESLELLAGGSPVTHLNLHSNALTSLEALSALHNLRELRASSNRLASLQGVHMLGRLTSLDVSHNSLESLPSLAGLPALVSLDLSANRLSSAAMAAAGLHAGACAQLTSLRLADNHQLAELGTWLGPLPSLLRLDVSGCGLRSLEGLQAAAPLLQELAASGNQITCLPPSLGLPLLRELWLGGNQLAVVPAWPWLPSLQGLHLQDNGLTHLAPLRGFLRLQAIDLSFNQLPGLAAVLASLAPASATLCQLRLNDNPLAGPWAEQRRHQRIDAAGGDSVAAGEAYPSAVFRTLPWLQELDSQPVELADRRKHLQAADRRSPPMPAWHGWRQVNDGAWDAATLEWVLAQPTAAEEVARADSQQRAMAFSAVLAQAEEQPAPETPEVASLATALASLQQAAASGQAMPCNASSSEASSSRSSGCRNGLAALRLAQQQYLLLAAGQPSAAQSLMLLSPGHYQSRLQQLHTAATSVQAAWRGCRARRMRAQWVAEQQAAREAAAATDIQAAWRGWVCRQRRCTWVQHRLVVWRHEWHEAQRRLLLHRQECAAVKVQAVWRGARVRGLLALARLSLQQQRQQQQQQAGAAGGLGSPELGAELSVGSLDGFLDAGGSCMFASPEVLQPEHGFDGGSTSSGLGGSAWQDGSAPAPPGSAPAAWAGTQQLQLPSLAALAGWGPAGASGSGGAGGPPWQANLTQSACSATSASPAAGGAGGEAGWQFSDPATAAAYAQLRQRQQAVARRRELQQQMKDPLQRLHLFQGRSATLPARLGGSSGCGSGVAAPHAAAGLGCNGGRSCASTCSSPARCSLPALRSPRPAQLGSPHSTGCGEPLSGACSGGAVGGSSAAAGSGLLRRGSSRRRARPSINVLQLASL
ncbi:hypothetical protein ABPG75_000584 [Micractinium tetrahymenae]